MTSATYIYLESEGLMLPDGTVFGGGVELKFQIMKGESRPNAFTIYEFIGGIRVAKFNHDNLGYREMVDWLHSEVEYYETAGMKLWEANHSEFDKATYKKQVTLEW